jgi:signal transduction histidine kinase
MHRYVTTGEAHVINQRIEMTAMHREGHEFPVELAITRVALEDQHKHEFCAFIRDITRRKQAEDEIRNSLERQRELNQLKSRFVSMASHEFRTPLATILSSAELLKYYAERMGAEERLEMLATIETAVRRMTDMLDDVLLIGKSDAGMLEFQPQPLALHAFCRRIVEELRVGGLDTARHNITLRLEGEEPGAMFDEKLLRHIFGNLLSNAVKYSPEGGEVRFEVEGLGEQVRFMVSDQGIGITAQDRERLFETFFRGSNVGTISGTGLGLAIVKRSVDLHGGRIEVHSEGGRGTQFVVMLPCLAAQPV